MPGQKQKKQVAQEPKKITLRERININEDTRIRIMKVSGMVAGVFAVFTFIAVLSYLFTWKADQSLLSDPQMMDKAAEVNNMGGKLGYRWGHFLVGRCFGLGSFALVVLLAAASVRLFFRKRSIGMLRTTVLTVSGAIVTSVIFSFVSGLVSSDTVFGGGLGGDCGAYVSELFVNLVGNIATALILIVFVVVWLLYASGRFSEWLMTAGEKDGVAEDDKNIPCAEAEVAGQNSDVIQEQAATDEETVLSRNDIVAEEIIPAVNWDIRSMSQAFDDKPVSLTGEEYAEESVGPDNDVVLSDTVAVQEVNEPEVPEDKGIEIVQGVQLSTDVKELPRIDTRAELEKFKFPPIDFLNDYADGRHEVDSEELERNNNKIRATLLNYKIQIEKVTACVGPTVTLYKITPAPGVKISAIRSLEEDIAVALGAKGVRVVTLADAVGIEVANDRASIVPLKSVLNDSSFRNSKYELPVALGYTITQKVKTFDLTAAPHLLVAGATQQGKSVGLNVIISSLLYAKHPSELKFVFIDPKMVEFNAYAKLLKHYLAVLPTAANETDEMGNAIVKQAKQAEEILRSLCMEMDERYQLMSRTSANNIKLYNEKYKDRHLLPTDGHRFMPYLVVVIDEYSDLIMSGGSGAESKNLARSIQASIIRLAQKGRAAGIHVIIATQRPSVDVITGLIKTNFPMRIAFRTVTRVDSNTILDTPGAEKLIGKGDMLFYAGVEMERVQCALVGMDEIYKITNFIGDQTGYRQCYNTPYYLPAPEPAEGAEGQGMIDMQNLDEMFRAAAEMVVINQQGSTSTLQRKLGMGYARAGRVMDQLEAAGIVGPQEGSKPRQVLVPDLSTLNGILDAFMNN